MTYIPIIKDDMPEEHEYEQTSLRRTFRFEISGSLADFAIFCAIIRGESFNDDAKLQAMTASLKASTTAQAAAVAAVEQADSPTPTP